MCPHCQGYDYVKNGTYATSYAYIQKYYCKYCDKHFIENEFKGEKKPEVKEQIINLYEEGKSQREIAKELGISKRTVYKKIKAYKDKEENN